MGDSISYLDNILRQTCSFFGSRAKEKNLSEPRARLRFSFKSREKETRKQCMNRGIGLLLNYAAV